MKKIIWPAFILIFIMGCSESNNRNENSVDLQANKGYHFNPNHGVNNQPIGVYYDGDIYHMYLYHRK